MLHQAISEERILDVDSVRGFALFGILIVNICAFLSPFTVLRWLIHSSRRNWTWRSVFSSPSFSK
ncbi:hypothetical protein [Rhizobium herbae]